jgi:DNA-binding NtrC family response regulator
MRKAIEMILSKKAVLLVNAYSEESEEISCLLREAGCIAHTIGSVSELKNRLKERGFIAVIMDIDSVAVDNRSIKDIASEFPDIPLLCISRKPFHPDLTDSIRDYIYACLTKPIDPDELNYWLKCIQEDNRSLTVG